MPNHSHCLVIRFVSGKETQVWGDLGFVNSVIKKLITKAGLFEVVPELFVNTTQIESVVLIED